MPPGRRRGRAETSPDAVDPRLRPRTLAVPFETVWQAAGRLVSGGLRRWSLQHADDREGIIEALARGLGSAEHDVVIRIGLDADAQTTVTASVTARQDGADYGRAERRLLGFLTALDEAVSGVPEPQRSSRAP
jgi:hypothetical protein